MLQLGIVDALGSLVVVDATDDDDLAAEANTKEGRSLVAMSEVGGAGGGNADQGCNGCCAKTSPLVLDLTSRILAEILRSGVDTATCDAVRTPITVVAETATVDLEDKVGAVGVKTESSFRPCALVSKLSANKPLW